MAYVTIIKHTRDKNFPVEFKKWVQKQELVKKCNIQEEDVQPLLKIISQFSNEIDMMRAIREHSHFITDGGLHHVASKLLEEFIKEDTHYIILDNVEVYTDDHMLVVLTD